MAHSMVVRLPREVEAARIDPVRWVSAHIHIPVCLPRVLVLVERIDLRPAVDRNLGAPVASAIVGA